MAETTTPPLDQRDLQVWTWREWSLTGAVLLVAVMFGLAVYTAVQAHRANEYAQIATSNTTSTDSSGYEADSAVENVCTLLGAVAKKEGIAVSTLFGPDETACSSAATAGAVKTEP